MRTMSARALLIVLLSLVLITGFALAQSKTDTLRLPLMALLTATPTPTLSPTPTSAATPVINRSINIGDVITESLSGATTSAQYYFEGKAGQYVSISLQIELPYTELQLLDSSGANLANGYFNNPDSFMEISAFLVPHDGRYTIALYRQIGLTDFTLKLTELAVKNIAYGQVIDDILTAEQPSILYRFHGNRFDTIDLSLASTDFDVYLSLLQSSGFELIADDNSGGGRNAFLGLYHLLENDDYLILVRGRSGAAAGAFQLRLIHPEFIPLDFEQPVQVNFTADAPVVHFGFQGSAGDIVHLGVDSGMGVDTLLQVSLPEYFLGPSDDDSGTGFDPEIGPWTLQYEGQYQILVRPFIIGLDGQVTLTVSRQILPLLNDDPLTIELTQKQPFSAVRFDGKAGESVQLTFVFDPLITNAPRITVTQDGDIIASSDEGIALPFSLEFSVPSDGIVIVEIADYQSGPGTVQIALQRSTP